MKNTEKQINITLVESPENEGKPHVIILREGDAAPIIQPDKVSLTGTIDSPREYATIRPLELVPEKAIVQYHYESGYIKLNVDPTDKFAATILGTLVENKEIKTLGINSETTTTIQELARTLKMRRALFTDRDKHTKLLGNLNKFKLQAQTQIEQEQSDRGSKKGLFEVKVTSDIPLDFTLSMPLFVGQPERTFKVEVCFDVRDGGIDVWLDSVELAEALKDAKKQIIDAELKHFEKLVRVQLA